MLPNAPRPLPTGLCAGAGGGGLHAPCAAGCAAPRPPRTRRAPVPPFRTMATCTCTSSARCSSSCVCAQERVAGARALQTSWCAARTLACAARRIHRARTTRPCPSFARWPHAHAHRLQDLCVCAQERVAGASAVDELVRRACARPRRARELLIAVAVAIVVLVVVL